MPNWFIETGLWVLVAVLTAAASYGLVRLALRWVLPKVARWFTRVPLLAVLVVYVQTFSRWLEAVLGLAFAVGAVIGILAELGVDIGPVTRWLNGFGLDAARWAGTHGIRVLVIVTVVYLISRIAGRVLTPVLRTTLSQGKDGVELEEASKRANALAQVGLYAVTSVATLGAGFMVLSEFGFNLAPLLTGVGIVGIALGFGAQHLVRDLISGAFILFEDQYRVGDVASVGGKTGLVEEINLRRTVLRDLDGIVHTIPNGEITTASNFTKSFSRVNLDVAVAYKEDLDHVIRVLNRVGIGLARDDYYGDLIIDPPQVLRVNSFDDSGIGIKMLGVTKPIRQWEVMGELRRRIKREFDREGIEIPYPHRTIYWGVDSNPRAESAGFARSETLVPVEAAESEPALIADPWAKEPVAAAAEGSTTQGQASEGVLDNLMAHLDQVRALLNNPPVALFTDIDGTLALIAAEPRYAKISPAVRQALGVLSQRTTVVVLTGRDLAGARRMLGLPSVIYQGNHGIESWERGTSASVAGAQPMTRRIHRLARAVKSTLGPAHGVLIEDKEFSLAFHYRQAMDPGATHELILKALERAPEAKGLTIHEGKMVVEARLPIDANKGTALRSVVEQHGIQSALVLGDDLTDVDSFQMLDQLRQETGLTGVAVAVLGMGAPPALLAAADFQLADPEAVEIFLSWMAAEVR